MCPTWQQPYNLYADGNRPPDVHWQLPDWFPPDTISEIKDQGLNVGAVHGLQHHLRTPTAPDGQNGRPSGDLSLRHVVG